MSITFACPECLSPLEYGDQAAGKNFRCAYCKKEGRIPRADEPQSARGASDAREADLPEANWALFAFIFRAAVWVACIGRVLYILYWLSEEWILPSISAVQQGALAGVYTAKILGAFVVAFALDRVTRWK